MAETFMHELNDGVGATVNARLVPIVKFLNRLSVTTISSYLDGDFASITFTSHDSAQMAELLFKHLHEMTAHMDGVHLELSFDSFDAKVGFSGLIEVRAEDIDDLSSRVGVWLEQLRK